MLDDDVSMSSGETSDLSGEFSSPKMKPQRKKCKKAERGEITIHFQNKHKLSKLHKKNKEKIIIVYFKVMTILSFLYGKNVKESMYLYICKKNLYHKHNYLFDFVLA